MSGVAWDIPGSCGERAAESSIDLDDAKQMSMRHYVFVTSPGILGRLFSQRERPDTSDPPSSRISDLLSADELDRQQLEQLHAATLKASDSCFELKKLCATIVVPAATLVAVFTDHSLDSAVFISGLLIVGAFWLADAVGFYYQRKLRAAMAAIWARRAARCSEPYTHAPQVEKVSAARAAFNASMLFYLILASVICIGLVLYLAGAISSTGSTT